MKHILAREGFMRFFFISSLLLAFILVGCNQNNDSEKTIDEAISNDLENVNDLFLVKETEKGVIVLYETNPQAPNFDEVTAIAFFSGDDKLGWEYLKKRSGWTYYSNDNMTVYHQPIPQEVAAKKNTRIIFGEINNPTIQDVQVKDKEGNFVSATILNEDNKNIYYIIGKFNDVEVRGLSKDKEIIDQQG